MILSKFQTSLDARHYQSLLPEDLHWIINRLPKYVVETLQIHPLFLAGGFIRAVIANEPVNDIDVLGPDKKTLDAVVDELQARTHLNLRPYATENAITLLGGRGAPLQLVHRWKYEAPAPLLDEFDFTIAQAVIWYEHTEHSREAILVEESTNTGGPIIPAGKWYSACSPRFYADLAAKRLVYTAPVRSEDAGGSLLRMQKFLRRGYNIAPESTGRLLARIHSGIDWDRVDDTTRDNPNGRERYVGRLYTSLLREVDPLNVIDGIEIADGRLQDSFDE